jgi:hypothetical protein
VLRRSDSDKGGDSGFLLELLRESQVKGLVSFRDIAGGGFSFSGTCGGGGGGGNLTGAMVPERPCRAEAELVESRESRGGRVGSRPGVFIPSVQRQLGTGTRRKGMGVPSVNDTSSMSEVTEMRCAVSKGDFARGVSSVEASSAGVSVVSVASFVSFVSAVSAVSATSAWPCRHWHCLRQQARRVRARLWAIPTLEGGGSREEETESTHACP